jgi:hypothetical protein
MAEVIISSLNSVAAGNITVPSGCYLREIIQIEKAGFKVLGGIKYGTTEGDDDLVASFNMDANSQDRISIDHYRTPSVVYFDAVDDWNGASVDIYIILGSLSG